MAEEETKEQSSTEEVKEEQDKNLADLLSAFAGAPSEEVIEEWKNNYGEIFCSGFSAVELYIFRPLNRKEHVQQQIQVAEAQAQGRPVGLFEAEELVVDTCLLWQSSPGKKALEQKAGSMSTLNEQIMQNSNFVNPAMASALVIKL